MQVNTTIVGYARSAKTDDEFRSSLKEFLKASDSSDKERRDRFLARCIYRNGDAYGSHAAWTRLAEELTNLEDAATARHASTSGDDNGGNDGTAANRVFYFAIPPTAYQEAAEAVRACALSSRGWNRVVVEKPFGRDLESSDELSQSLQKHFREDQVRPVIAPIQPQRLGHHAVSFFAI